MWRVQVLRKLPPPRPHFQPQKDKFVGSRTTFQTPLDKHFLICYTGLTILLLEGKSDEKNCCRYAVLDNAYVTFFL